MELIEDYYIIESLEENDIHDGKVFNQSLNLLETFNPIYKEVITFEDLEEALKDFVNSTYRYLFISTHGDQENLMLRDKTSVNIYDLLEIEISLEKRRIFMSTCQGGSFLFAKFFIKKGAYSVVGTPNDLNQIVAVSMWTAMLITFERMNPNKLGYTEINTTLKLFIKIYRITLHYYSFIRDENKMKEYVYNYGKKRLTEYYEI